MRAKSYEIYNNPDFNYIEAAKRFNQNPLLIKVLVARGYDTEQKLQDFFTDVTKLSDPFELKDMSLAVQRIRLAIETNEKIVVFGDYDVDGITSTALLFSYLTEEGAKVYFKLPQRTEDGYGLSRSIIELFHTKGVSLIITVDNGISAVQEVEYAKKLGIDIIITDHHLPPDILPAAVAIVDPAQKDDTSSAKNLCGVGVVFKLVAALEGCEPEELLHIYGDYVALGTVADVMILQGENRELVRCGLELINERSRAGIAALIEVSGYGKKQVSASTLAFTIAPKINAAGRMGDASLALNLLLCEDEEEAGELAEQLVEINKTRQETERQLTAQIIKRIEQDNSFAQDYLLVIEGEGYHAGVIGIVCSRILEKFQKPVIILSIEGGVAKGSGRSTSGFSLFNALESCKEHLIKYGGHDHAAGMAISADKIKTFRAAINKYAKGLGIIPKAPLLNIDAELQASEITIETIQSLELLQPFGHGNKTPTFILRNVTASSIKPLSNGAHIRITFASASGFLQATMFNCTAQQFPYSSFEKLDIVVELSVFEGQNSAMVSARLVDIRPFGLCNTFIQSCENANAYKLGFSLSKENLRSLLPSYDDVAQVYKFVIAQGIYADNILGLFKALGEENSGRIIIALQMLLQLDIIKTEQINGAVKYVKSPKSEKKDLKTAPVYLQLVEQIDNK